MRFLHTSDWHLGMSFRGGFSYLEDQRFALWKVCQIAAEEKVDGILLAGDVFDKSIASQEALKLYDEVMTHICRDLKIPIYLIAGNHDGAERISQCNELLKQSGLYIAGALTNDVQVYNSGDTDIYLLPWISTDKVRTIYPKEASEINSMEEAYLVVLDKVREKFVPTHKNILVSHAFIVNAETSTSDRSAEIGQATMIGSFVFDGFDYVALGHLHAPQTISNSIRYSGSLMPYSFGKEENHKKSVTIVDTENMVFKTVEIPQLHKRITIKGTYEQLMSIDYSSDIRNGYVRLEVTDSYVGLDSIAVLREKFKNLLEVSGKSFERDDTRITMTMEEFERVNTNPETVFEHYCMDNIGEKPDDRLAKLFNKAVSAFEREVVEDEA